MKKKSEPIEAKLTLISRSFVYISILLFAIAGTFIIIPHSVKWLIPSLFISGALLGLICGIIPGILIIIGYPSLAYAWRNGRYPYAFSDTSWELLSNNQKRTVYFDSIITLLVIIVFVIWTISKL